MPKSSNLTQRTISGGVWQFLAIATYAIVQLIVLAILARLIKPEEFGVLAIANMVAGFATLFSQIGLGPALIQRKDLNAAHLSTAFFTALIIAFVFVIVLWGIAPAVSIFFKAPDSSAVLRVVSWTFLLRSFGLVPESLLQKKLQFKKLMWASFGGYVIGYGLVSIVCAWLGFGVWALVVGLLGNAVIDTALLVYLSDWKISLGFNVIAFRELINYGGGQTLMRFFNYSALQADYFVTGRVLGPTALGLYERAFSLMVLPGKYVGDVLDKVLFPAMSQIQDDKSRLAQVYLRGIEIINLVLLPASIFLIVWADYLIDIALGPKWSELVLPFQILAVGISVRTMVRMCDSLVRASGNVYRSAALKFIYLLSVLIGSWLGTPYGIAGVSVGVSIAALINFLLMSWLGLQIVQSRWVIYAAKLVPGLRMGLILFILNTLLRLSLITLNLNAFILIGIVLILNTLLGLGLWFYFDIWFGPGILWFVENGLLTYIPEHLRKFIIKFLPRRLRIQE